MATTYTWGTGGTYASIQAILTALGSLSEDIECRLAGNTTHTSKTDWEVVTDTYNQAGYTITVTNPDDYTYNINTGTPGAQIYNLLSRTSTTGPIIFDGMDWEIASTITGKFCVYGSGNQITFKNCTIKDDASRVDGVFLRYDTSADLIMYNVLYLGNPGSRFHMFSAYTGTGVIDMENCTIMNIDTFGFGSTSQNFGDVLNTYCEVDNILFSNVPSSITMTTLATNYNGQVPDTDLRNLQPVNIFEKYLTTDWGDADYVQPKSDTVLSTDAGYPPSISGHTTFYDGTVITADNAIIGYKFIAVAGDGIGYSNIVLPFFGNFIGFFN